MRRYGHDGPRHIFEAEKVAFRCVDTRGREELLPPGLVELSGLLLTHQLFGSFLLPPLLFYRTLKAACFFSDGLLTFKAGPLLGLAAHLLFMLGRMFLSMARSSAISMKERVQMERSLDCACMSSQLFKESQLS